MLRWDLCCYSDAYIDVKGTVTVEGIVDNNRRNKKLTFSSHAPIRLCISKINNTLIENAEDLDIVKPMFNLLEYSNNYSVTTRSLWNYHRDKMINDANENNEARN